MLRRTVSAGTVETGEQILSNRELVRTEFYHDFLKPNIWLHACSAVTDVEDSTFSSVYALRSPRNRAFTPGEIELCSYLAPHLQTAAQIRQRILDLEATLDRLLVGDMDTNALTKLGLTPAETRLAGALFKGQSVEAYAKEAAISINTKKIRQAPSCIAGFFSKLFRRKSEQAKRKEAAEQYALGLKQRVSEKPEGTA